MSAGSLVVCCCVAVTGPAGRRHQSGPPLAPARGRARGKISLAAVFAVRVLRLLLRLLRPVPCFSLFPSPGAQRSRVLATEACAQSFVSLLAGSRLQDSSQMMTDLLSSYQRDLLAMVRVPVLSIASLVWPLPIANSRDALVRSRWMRRVQRSLSSTCRSPPSPTLGISVLNGLIDGCCLLLAASIAGLPRRPAAAREIQPRAGAGRAKALHRHPVPGELALIA